MRYWAHSWNPWRWWWPTGRFSLQLVPLSTRHRRTIGNTVSNVSQQFDALVKKAEETVRQRAAGDRIRIQVGSATCEQAAGADEVFDEFRKHVAASGRSDILLHRTGCTGRCSREPIVGVFVPGQMPIKYERVDRQLGPRDLHPARAGRPARCWTTCSTARSSRSPSTKFSPAAAIRCGWKGERPFGDGARARSCAAAGFTAERRPRDRRRVASAPAARPTAGNCSHMLVRPDKILYRIENEADLDEIVREHLLGGQAGRAPGGARARRSAGSSSSSTATWPSSIARAAWPCGTTA